MNTDTRMHSAANHDRYNDDKLGGECGIILAHKPAPPPDSMAVLATRKQRKETAHSRYHKKADEAGSLAGFGLQLICGLLVALGLLLGPTKSILSETTETTLHQTALIRTILSATLRELGSKPHSPHRQMRSTQHSELALSFGQLSFVVMIHTHTHTYLRIC